MSSRYAKEFHRLKQSLEKKTNGQAFIKDWDPDNITSFIVEVSPQGGPYKQGKFLFQIIVPDLYPDVHPDVVCLTDIYHPNIDSDITDEHNICLNLFDEWNKSFGLEDCVQGLIFLLYNPNLSDPISSFFDGSVESQASFVSKVQASLRGESFDGISFAKNPGYVGLENSGDDDGEKRKKENEEEEEVKENGAMSAVEAKKKPDELTLITDEPNPVQEAEPSPRQDSPPNEAYCSADELPCEDVNSEMPTRDDSPPISPMVESTGEGAEAQSTETPAEEEKKDPEEEKKDPEEGIIQVRGPMTVTLSDDDFEEDEDEDDVGDPQPVIALLTESSDDDAQHANFLPYEEPEFAWTEQELNEEQPFMDALGCRFVYANQSDSSHEDTDYDDSSAGDDDDFLFEAGEEDEDSEDGDEDEEGGEGRLEDEVIDLGTSRIIIRPVRRRLNQNSTRRRWAVPRGRGREIVVEEVEAGLVWPLVRRTMTRAVGVLRPYHSTVWSNLTFWEVGALWTLCVWLFGNLSARRRVTRRVLR